MHDGAQGPPRYPQQGHTPPPSYPGHAGPTGPQVAQAQGPTNVFAILSLVSALVGLVGILPIIGSVIAIVFSVLGKNEIQRQPHQRGKEFADWGMILGIVGLVIWTLISVLMLFLALLFGGLTRWFWEWPYWM